MKRTPIIPLVLGLLVGCVEQGQTPLEPSFELPRAHAALIVQHQTELPTFGGVFTIAFAGNNLGQVVGQSLNVAGDARAFLWENGAMQALGTLGGPHSHAYGVNDAGQVVGSSENAFGSSWAFLWQNGAMQDLGGLFKSGGSVARDINDLGQVVGESTLISGDHAFLWQTNTVMQDLGTLGGISSIALGINNLTEVVGLSRNSSGDQKAFLWKNSVMQDLGTLAGGTTSAARSINNLSDVVGVSENSAGDERAVLWKNGALQDLGVLGRTHSMANDINELGQVVGVSFNTPDAPLAFLWVDGTMYGLGSGSAYGINNDGQVVGELVVSGVGSFGVVWDVPIRPPVDIQPGDAINKVKLKDKSISVAILSNRWFSAQDVHPGTVTLGDEQGSDTPVVRDKKGTPLAVYRDIDSDGDTDLVLEFTSKELQAKSDLTASTAKLVLLGMRADGRAFRAVEPVKVVP